MNYPYFPLIVRLFCLTLPDHIPRHHASYSAFPISIAAAHIKNAKSIRSCAAHRVQPGPLPMSAQQEHVCRSCYYTSCE